MSNHQATHHRSNAPKNPDQDEAIADRLTQGQTYIYRCTRCATWTIERQELPDSTCGGCMRPRELLPDRRAARLATYGDRGTA